MKNYKRIALLVLIVLINIQARAQVNKQTLSEFIERILPGRSAAFIIEEIPQQEGKDVFGLESRDGKVVLKGNNGLSVASALNHYLKRYVKADIGWNGNNVKLPAELPMVTEAVQHHTPYKYRYYLNYCTFQYSMAWWSWERWQREIDWMALNGINMPLALTGEEAIWDDVYTAMGFTRKDLDGFFTGPAYFSWLWMGNIDAVGGPLPQQWIASHRELQKKILARQRAFGMTPVLPAFTGHVPPSFKEKFPQAKLHKANWELGFADTYILDPADPLFDEIGRKFIEAQAKEYGTDHYYSADTFNENTPHTNDSTYLNDISKKVYHSMAQADPRAVWVMQGWMFSYGSKFWQPTQMKALLNAVPNDKMIILDLWSETHPVWNKSEAFYGKPWIWNMLHNFGGNISLFGRMQQVADDPAAALNDPKSGTMAGIGLTPEGIEQNPVIYQLMLENVWQDKPIDVASWLKDYALRRYGKNLPEVDKAWNILRNTVYKGDATEGGPETILQARPMFASENERVKTKLHYKPQELLKAWDMFVKASPQLAGSDGFEYDLVDITRQVLANYALPVHTKMVAAYKRKNYTAFDKHAAVFLQLISDMDALLATREDFLLGKWLADARACGVTTQQKDLYEFNARSLITLWGGRDCPINEYSNRQWAGLLNGFYKPRWEMFFTYLKANRASNTPPDMKVFTEKVKDWEWQWVNNHNAYPVIIKGNAINTVNMLHAKYRKQLAMAYRIKP